MHINQIDRWQVMSGAISTPSVNFPSRTKATWHSRHLSGSGGICSSMNLTSEKASCFPAQVWIKTALSKLQCALRGRPHFFCFLVYWFQFNLDSLCLNRVSCAPGLPQAHNVAKANFASSILLPEPSKPGVCITGVCHHAQAKVFSEKKNIFRLNRASPNSLLMSWPWDSTGLHDIASSRPAWVTWDSF